MKKTLIYLSLLSFSLLGACSNDSSISINQVQTQDVSAMANKNDDFSKTDLNKDGFVDYKELLTIMMESQPYFYGDVKAVAKQLFTQTDKDKDGKISRKEYYPSTNSISKSPSILAKVSVSQSDLDKYFAEVDLNKNGAISYEELETQMMESQPYFYGDVKVVAKQLFAHFDLNKDNKITKTEYKKAQQH